MNPQLVEKCVAALLQSAPQQLPLNHFLEEYRNIMFQDLPYRELGHANPTAYLLALQQTVRVTIDEAGGVFLDCVPDPDMDHIRRLVNTVPSLRSSAIKAVLVHVRRVEDLLHLGLPRSIIKDLQKRW